MQVWWCCDRELGSAGGEEEGTGYAGSGDATGKEGGGREAGGGRRPEEGDDRWSPPVGDGVREEQEVASAQG